MSKEHVPDGANSGEAGLPLTGRLLLGAVTLSGLLLLAVGAIGLVGAALNWSNEDRAVLLVLVLLAIAAERFDFSLYGDSRVSLAFVPMFASLFVAGFPGLSLVLPPAIIASAVGAKRPLYKTAFNVAALALAGGASALVLGAFGSLNDPGRWPQVIIPATAAAAANFAANSALVALAISITSRTLLRSVWTEHFMWLWPHYLVLGMLGLAVASATDAMGVWGIAVFLAPPLMMRLSVKQYVDRTTKGVLELRDAHGELQVAHQKLTHAMVDLGRAYDGTLRSLVAALDARDSETGGHSERVADLTMAIAAELDLDPDSDDWRYIQWGALLHDVGKIAVPDAILRKPGKLSDEEWVTMRTHPRAGFEIIRSVEFLAPAAEIVLAHHERFDGAGYPGGLAGEDIPLGARIFMIADTFDAITCARPYKPARPPEEALAEILRHSGTQFDPAAVQAFLSVYRKRFVGKASQSHGLGRIARQQLNEALERAIGEAEARKGSR